MASFSNLGIKLISTGDEAGTWGTSTNDNFELFDTAIVGYVNVVLVAAGSSGSPNQLQITDFTASNGRNRVIEFTDAGDLGATAYVQVIPSDFEGYWFIRNSLSGSRSILLFQGTYNSSRDYEIPAGKNAVVRCTGGGTTSYVYNILEDLYVGSIQATSGITATSITAGGTFDMGTNKITNLGTPTAGTDAATKAYVDAAGSIVFTSGNQILFRASAAGTGSVPSGWTVAAQDNKALRIVSGTPSSGGATAFTSAFNAAVTSASGGSHSHTFSGTTGNYSSLNTGPILASGGAAYRDHTHTFSGTTSTASAHTHSVTIPDLQYYDFNVIQKT